MASKYSRCIKPRCSYGRNGFESEQQPVNFLSFYTIHQFCSLIKYNCIRCTATASHYRTTDNPQSVPQNPTICKCLFKNEHEITSTARYHPDIHFHKILSFSNKTLTLNPSSEGELCWSDTGKRYSPTSATRSTLIPLALDTLNILHKTKGQPRSDDAVYGS